MHWFIYYVDIREQNLQIENSFDTKTKFLAKHSIDSESTSCKTQLFS
jgi:hypothetical protein